MGRQHDKTTPAPLGGWLLSARHRVAKWHDTCGAIDQPPLARVLSKLDNCLGGLRCVGLPPEPAGPVVDADDATVCQLLKMAQTHLAGWVARAPHHELGSMQVKLRLCLEILSPTSG